MSPPPGALDISRLQEAFTKRSSLDHLCIQGLALIYPPSESGLILTCLSKLEARDS
jgi:hypothetical protein